MSRPLYRDIAPEKSKESNAGLWYDKYCDQWQVDRKSIWTLGAKDNANPKLKWIKKVTENRVGEDNLLAEACERQKTMVESTSAPGPLVIRTQWHFVSGLGRQHPIENGFTWHHSLGVPYLPGSSIKGMVRNWASQWEGAEPEDIKRIFGPRNPKSTETTVAGSVIFLDALPTEPVLLKADVMTPHYSEYYTERKPPADWISPVPIPFLVVAKNQPFQFALMPRYENEQSQKDLGLVQAWLKDALENIGAGAKTASGYGVFRQNEGGISPPVKEVWEKAQLQWSPGDGTLTALYEGRIARGNSRNNGKLKAFIDSLSKGEKQKLKRGGLARSVQVDKSSDNCLSLKDILNY